MTNDRLLIEEAPHLFPRASRVIAGPSLQELGAQRFGVVHLVKRMGMRGEFAKAWLSVVTSQMGQIVVDIPSVQGLDLQHAQAYSTVPPLVKPLEGYPRISKTH